MTNSFLFRFSYSVSLKWRCTIELTSSFLFYRFTTAVANPSRVAQENGRESPQARPEAEVDYRNPWKEDGRIQGTLSCIHLAHWHRNRVKTWTIALNQHLESLWMKSLAADCGQRARPYLWLRNNSDGQVLVKFRAWNATGFGQLNWNGLRKWTGRICARRARRKFFFYVFLFSLLFLFRKSIIFFPCPDRLMNVNFWLVFLWHQNAVTIKERQISSGNADINKRENRFNYPIPNWKSHRNSALIQPNSAAFWLKFILNPSNTWLKFNQDLNQIWAKSVEDLTKDWFEFIQNLLQIQPNFHSNLTQIQSYSNQIQIKIEPKSGGDSTKIEPSFVRNLAQIQRKPSSNSTKI